MANDIVYNINVNESDDELDRRISEKIEKLGLSEPDEIQTQDDILPKTTRRRKKRKALTSSRAPGPYYNEKDDRGGIYGEFEEEDKGFEERQGEGGGIPVKNRFRDKISETPAPHERWIKQIKRIEDQLTKNEQQAEALEDFLRKFGGLGVSGASGLVSDPEGFIGDTMINILGNAGPYGALITVIIGLIVSTPALAKQLIALLAVKGGPLNEDFKIIIEDVITGFLSHPAQYKRDIGIEGFVVSQVGGFNTIAGTDVTNSLFESDEIRINRPQPGE